MTASSARETVVKIAVYAVVFGSLIAQGAFFNAWTLLLCLFCIALILFQKQPVKIDANALWLTGLFGFALVSAVFFADNPYTAMGELAKYALYPLSYLAFLNFEDKRFLETAFYRAILLLGAAGLLAVAGFSLIPNMVIQNGLRLQSFLQYANTTAVLLGAGILIALHRWLADKDWIHLVSLAVLGAALVLTQSRISFWVFLAVLALMLFERLGRKGRILFAAAVGVLIAVFALLGYRTLRVSLFEPTLVERFITFHDALHVLKTNLFGLGLGDWQLEQTLFQSAPYYVKYIHSGYFNIALDCGIGGLLCFAAAIATGLWRGVKALRAPRPVPAEKSSGRAKNIKAKGVRGKNTTPANADTGAEAEKPRGNVCFYILLLIAVCSVLDVNFNFGFVIAFCMLALATLGSRPVFTLTKRAARLPLLAPAVLLAVFLLSEAAVFAGNRSRENPQAAAAAYHAAQVLNPWNYRVDLERAHLERDPAEALQLLERGHAQNPLDREVIMELCKGYAHTGDSEKAVAYARLAFEHHRYSAATQENLRETLAKANEQGALSDEAYQSQLDLLSQEIGRINGEIHTLYRYIDADMEY